MAAHVAFFLCPATSMAAVWKHPQDCHLQQASASGSCCFAAVRTRIVGVTGVAGIPYCAIHPWTPTILPAVTCLQTSVRSPLAGVVTGLSALGQGPFHTWHRPTLLHTHECWNVPQRNTGLFNTWHGLTVLYTHDKHGTVSHTQTLAFTNKKRWSIYPIFRTSCF